MPAGTWCSDICRSRSGAGFALERFDFLSSLATPNRNYIWNQVDQDRRKWFRPSDVAVGADGAIYVADWYDPIVGGHQMHDGKGHGRIYRITPKGRTLTTPSDRSEHDRRSNPGAAQSGGQRAQQRLRAAQGERAGGAAGSQERPGRCQPVPPRPRDLAAGAARPGRGSGSASASSPTPTRRSASRRSAPCASVKSSVLEDEARRLSQDPSPAVRREVALSLRGVPFEESRDVLVKLAAGYDGTDRWYLEALGIAAAGHEDAAVFGVAACAGACAILSSGTRRFSALAWRLHPARAIDAFAARAASRRLTAERTIAGAGCAGLHQRSSRRAGDGRADAQRASGCRSSGRLVDDLPQDRTTGADIRSTDGSPSRPT